MLRDENQCRDEHDKSQDQSRRPNAAASRGKIPRSVPVVGHFNLGTSTDGASVPPRRAGLGVFAT
jgi:hypothetical protein